MRPLPFACWVLGGLLSAAPGPLASGAELSFDRYPSPGELTAALQEMARANPAAAAEKTGDRGKAHQLYASVCADTVKSGDRLKVKLVPGGGWAARFHKEKGR